MNVDILKIQKIRDKFDNVIMGISGVVSVGVGLDLDANVCLLIGANSDESGILSKIPSGVFDVPVRVVDMGVVEI